MSIDSLHDRCVRIIQDALGNYITCGNATLAIFASTYLLKVDNARQTIFKKTYFFAVIFA